MAEENYFKPRTADQMHRQPRKRIVRDPLEEGGVYKFVNGQLTLIEKQPIPAKPELVIKPGGLYKSRDGRKIQIWAINKESTDKPVVGMIQTEDIWETRYWNAKGVVKVPYGVGNDIVSEWSET